MLWKFLIWCVGALTSLVAPETPDVSYTMTLEAAPGAAPRVIVTLRCKGDADGQTELELRPEWGGHANDGSDVSDLSVTTASGQAIAISRREPWAWTATNAPGEPLIVRYAIRETPPRGDEGHGNDYRTRLEDGLLQCIPNLALLMPKWLDSDEPRTFSLELKGFQDAGWHAMSSWGDGPGVFTQHVQASDFLHAMILAARPDRARFHTRAIAGNTVGVAIVGNDWGFEDVPFIDLATKIITIERDFFQDHTDPWFLVALTPEGGRAKNGSFSLGGTGLRNCFTLYCNTGLSLEAGSPYAQRIAVLLAHEYFHTWNGLKIRTSADDGQGEGGGYWFSEGFTNFFARRLLHESGLIDDRAYAQNLSEALGSYDANPFKNAPNQKIRDGFWKDRDVGELPYQRGDLIALVLDEHLRKASGGKESLDDFMRRLLASCKDDSAVTTEELLALVRAAAGEEVAAGVRAAVIDGADVQIPEHATKPALRLTKRSIRAYDPGLNPEESQKAKQVVGVRDDGEAFKAGLRNGQKLRGFSIHGPDGKDAPKASVDVEIDGQVRTIRYEAVGEAKVVRAYELMP